MPVPAALRALLASVRNAGRSGPGHIGAGLPPGERSLMEMAAFYEFCDDPVPGAEQKR